MLIDIQKTIRPLMLPNVAQSLDYTCGAACFDSMFQYFTGQSLGELYFAEKLGTIQLGYTPPTNIVTLANDYGFSSTLIENAIILDFIEPLSKSDVIFVTWWDEDAGHYSLVKYLDDEHITLMDPWLARQGFDNRLSINEFEPHWQARGSKMIQVSRHQK